VGVTRCAANGNENAMKLGSLFTHGRCSFVSWLHHGANVKL
jgi:hypothetical protein